MSPPTVTYRFRCHACPYVTDVTSREALPTSCPLCGAGREMKDTAAVLKKGPGWKHEGEDRRH